MRTILLGTCAAVLAVSASVAQPLSHATPKAPVPGTASATDPAFLEALRDLRAAEVGIKTRKDKTPVSPHERAALNYTSTAAYIIQRDTNYKDSGTTTADVQVTPGEGRLHDVAAYLAKARHDLDTLSASSKLKSDCIEEIMNAQLEVGRALKDYASPGAVSKKS